MKKKCVLAFAVIAAFPLSSATARNCPCPPDEIEVIRDGKCRCIAPPHMMKIEPIAGGADIKINGASPEILGIVVDSISPDATIKVQKTDSALSIETIHLGREKAQELKSTLSPASRSLDK